ncbi:hypothetical protein [Actinomadura sp. CNU-125]|uniref:hypothetical protein n=1 Tax=Actinomadura sp. CNU-125 TaxID=1904961 RepID=UPI0011787BDF|nr:hypothetical protein [Actinomadura sp. CNU-125]
MPEFRLDAPARRTPPGEQRIGRPRLLCPAEPDMLHRLVGEEGVSVTEAARRPKVDCSIAYAVLAARSAAD